MKKYFITGLVVLTPLALTLAIVGFVFNFLTEPFLGVFEQLFAQLPIANEGFLFLSGEHIKLLLSRISILAALYFFTVALGFLGRWVLVNYLIGLSDKILHRIPLISSVYKTSQDVIKTVFTSQSKSFKQVVVVPFPSEKSQSVGLVTQDELPGLSSGVNKELVAVFLPTTPNPTSGFLMIFKKEEITYLDMSVEDAFKFIISCGVIMSPFRTITAEQSALNKETFPEDA